MFAKVWGERVDVCVNKEDYPERTMSLEEWLTEHFDHDFGHDNFCLTDEYQDDWEDLKVCRADNDRKHKRLIHLDGLVTSLQAKLNSEIAENGHWKNDYLKLLETGKGKVSDESL